MTYREHIQWMKKQWIGKKVRPVEEAEVYNVVDVDYNGMLHIDKKSFYTSTTAVNPSLVEEVEDDPIKIQKAKVKKLIEDHQPKNYDLHYVVLFVWLSPLTKNIETRSAAFAEYYSALEFANTLKAKYADMPSIKQFSVYIIQNDCYTFI